jgi:glycine reductase complex component B subunit gamma
MRIAHYLNQFFAGIGGEDRSDTPPVMRDGAVGAGLALQRALGAGAEVIGTVICGDGRFADDPDASVDQIVGFLAKLEPDVVIAGPAFNAGRYGLACARVCLEVEGRLHRPAVTAMHPENAAVAVHRKDVLIVPTTPTALGMPDAMRDVARIALKLGRGEPLGPAAAEGYLPQGRRANGRTDRPASARALDMLLARVHGAPFVSETPLPQYDRVAPPPPVTDLAHKRLAIVTECGLVPRGNPDRLEWVRASKWLAYDVPGDGFRPERYEVVHGGYDASAGTADPNRLVPLDALRELERRGEIGALAPVYYVTCGNHGVLSRMARYAGDIAADLRRRMVDAVLLVAT